MVKNAKIIGTGLATTGLATTGLLGAVFHTLILVASTYSLIQRGLINLGLFSSPPKLTGFAYLPLQSFICSPILLAKESDIEKRIEKIGATLRASEVTLADEQANLRQIRNDLIVMIVELDEAEARAESSESSNHDKEILRHNPVNIEEWLDYAEVSRKSIEDTLETQNTLKKELVGLITKPEEEAGSDKEEPGTNKEEADSDKEEADSDKEETGSDKEEAGSDEEESGSDDST
jgi:hypothetical protein